MLIIGAPAEPYSRLSIDIMSLTFAVSNSTSTGNGQFVGAATFQGLVLNLILILLLSLICFALFRRVKVRGLWRRVVWIPLFIYFTLVSALLAIEVASWFFSGLNEVPADFLTGLLAFDGIMTAVVALTYSSRFEGVSRKFQGYITLYTSFWFIFSALACLYCLLRLNPTTAGLAISAQNQVAQASLGASLIGIVVWLEWAVYFTFLISEKPKVAPNAL
jgi:hypothetical protein